MNPKKKTSVSLSQEATEMLDEMAKDAGISHSGAVEMAIRVVYKSGQQHREDVRRIMEEEREEREAEAEPQGG